jgi:hypothetical protein
MELRSQLHALATLTPVKEHVVPHRRLDGSQRHSEHFEEESPCSWMKVDDNSSIIQIVAQSL